MPTPSIIARIVEQHAEEAAFLWCLRDGATDQPQYTLRQLAQLEERLEAHIDGLRVAGDPGVEIAWANLDRFRGAGELFTVATLVLESNRQTKIEQVFDFAESVAGSRRGLFGALGWLSPRTLRGRAAAWLDAASAFRRLLGVVACSLHRADPGTRMERLLDDEPLIRMRALRLAGELGRIDLRQGVCLVLDDDDEGCRFWAAWSAGLLGERAAAIPVLQHYAMSGGRFQSRALDLVLRLMNRESAIEWIRGFGRDLMNMRLVVTAAGILGDPAVLPWLIDKMSNADLARVAGESFSMITGVDLAEQRLSGKALEAVTVGPTDEPADERVALDLDEYLPWPDPIKVQVWWQKQHGRYAGGVRHLRGLPLSDETCNRILRDGYQRQRRAAAYELALMSRGRPLWNWRTRAGVQMSSLNPLSQG